MVTDATLAHIQQKRFNSIAAKYIHVRLREKLNARSFRVDLLALAVPPAYGAVRYLAKNQWYQPWIEGAWELLAATLAFATAWKMLGRWQERGQRHSVLMGENISLIRRANEILQGASPASDESVNGFMAQADRSEKDDLEATGELSESDKQFAYREALKESSGPGTAANCPICKASAWRFVPGSCKACGNTPMGNGESE